MKRVRNMRFVAFLVALAATFIVQRGFGRYPLKTDQAPKGIVSFEFAGNAERAHAVVDAWRAAGLLEYARPNIIVVDSRFIPCYVATLFFGCSWASSAYVGRWATFGRWLAVGQPIAGGFDFVENAAMLHTLDALEADDDPGIYPAVASLCAALKFALVIVGIVYILVGAVAEIRRIRG